MGKLDLLYKTPRFVNFVLETFVLKTFALKTFSLKTLFLKNRS